MAKENKNLRKLNKSEKQNISGGVIYRESIPGYSRKY